MPKVKFRKKTGKKAGNSIKKPGIKNSAQIDSNFKINNSNEQLRATLNALPDLLFEVDIDGRIFDFRAPKPELLYSDPSTFLGEKVIDILPQNAASIILKSLKEADKSDISRGGIYNLEVNGVLHWFELSVAAKAKVKDQDRHFVVLARDITERKEFEEILRRKTEELKVERETLIEKNIALKQILDHIASEKKAYSHKLHRELEKAIMPIIKKLSKKIDKKWLADIESLESALNGILARDQADFEGRYSKLTSRESEICALIKEGTTSKQISQSLNISLATVLKHREIIRKKLGITNIDISLATYLRSHD
jgi:PAS domain S-box-containing protein